MGITRQTWFWLYIDYTSLMDGNWILVIVDAHSKSIDIQAV